jgi:hypothetical protein
MKASLMLSKTATAVGTVIVIAYGVRQFIKEQRAANRLR